MKKSTIIRIIFYSIFTCFVLYAFRFRIAEFIDNIFCDDYSMAEFTAEEKLEDFEVFYNTILQSAPYLDQVNELYQIDFRERKEYYINEIKETENLIQYYGVMKAISKDLASFHTDICFPLYSNLRGLACYQSKETLAKRGMRAKQDAWTDEIEKAIHSFENIEMISVRYVDGKYVVEKNCLSDCFREMEDYELVSIDGMMMEDYAREKISIYKIHYDFLWDKVYRERYIFNDSIGKKVNVVWRDLDGNQIEKDLYMDYGVDVAASYGYLFSDKFKVYNPIEPNVYMYRDEENQIEYVKINNFSNADGKKLKQYLQNAAYETIVIDLRNNYGGQSGYAKKYIYQALYDKEIVHSYQWKVPNSITNHAMIDDWTVRIGYSCHRDDDNYYYSNVTKYMGKQTEKKNIYYLVGTGTGSAADGFISAVKEHGLGTIVGTNTGGEGKGASYICSYLENSSLVYVYYPSMPVEEKEGVNSCAGIAPDVYISQTREEYNLEQQYKKEGTALEYDKRLQYDAALKWVIQCGK